MVTEREQRMHWQAEVKMLRGIMAGLALIGTGLLGVGLWVGRIETKVETGERERGVIVAQATVDRAAIGARVEKLETEVRLIDRLDERLEAQKEQLTNIERMLRQSLGLSNRPRYGHERPDDPQ